MKVQTIATSFLIAASTAIPVDPALAASPMVVDALGRAIGYAGSHSCTPGSGGPSLAFISRSGYAGCVPALTGMIGDRLGPPGATSMVGDDLSFISTDCSGPALICTTEAMSGGFMVRTRLGVFFAEQGSVSSWTDILSDIKVGPPAECSPRSKPQHVHCLDAHVFDAYILGLPSTRFTPPLHVEVRADEDLEDVIFFDEFEPL